MRIAEIDDLVNKTKIALKTTVAEEKSKIPVTAENDGKVRQNLDKKQAKEQKENLVMSRSQR